MAQWTQQQISQERVLHSREFAHNNKTYRVFVEETDMGIGKHYLWSVREVIDEELDTLVACNLHTSAIEAFQQGIDTVINIFNS